ncbi:MAG: RHS repeat protein, partial [Steroidobacteraceae bacterium]
NVTQATYLAGTSSAATWTYTYTSAFDEIASVTDPEGHTATYNYDSYGNLTSVVDANGNVATFGYNSAGQVISVTKVVNGNPLTTTLSYFGGDLASITDPMGRTTQ